MRIVGPLLMGCLLSLLRNGNCGFFDARKTLAELRQVCDELQEVEHLLAQKRKEQILQSARLPNNVVPIHYDLQLKVDLEKFTVIGRVDITVRCDVTSSYILLHSDKLEILEVHSRLPLRGQDGADSPTIASWSLHPVNQYLLLKLNGDLTKDGIYTITIKFKNTLDDNQYGFYRSSYINKRQQKRYLATSFFEPTGARKVFPCFDEPALKASYKITLVHQAEYRARSNMPIETSINREDGWVEDKFQTSPKMSSYIVVFVVSDLTSVGLTTKSGTKLNVVAQPHDIADGRGAYSLGISDKILTYYEDYFGVLYPLPKLDLVAVPDFPVKGEENWGLITFADTALLYDVTKPSAAAKKNVVHVVSHELAHMWFGNLVTMRWWDGIWLNEGITSYMERLGTDVVEPGMKVMDLFPCDVQVAMVMDSLTSSHPVYQPVRRPSEIGQLFDHITYRKGASLVRMLHHSVGEKVFRKAFKNYLRKYAYGTTVQDDLWKEFTKALVEEGQTELNVKSVMDTWILQMGYPVVKFTRDYKSGRAEVTQQHFLKDPSVSSEVPSIFGYRWYVPVSFSTKSTLNNNKNSFWMTPKEGTKIVDLKGAGSEDWILGNIRRVGFYRVDYDTKNWRLLISQLNSDQFQRIPVINRGVLVDDAFSLAGASMVDITLALDLSQYLVRERSYVDWKLAKSATDYIDSVLGYGTDIYRKWQDYMVHLITPFYSEVGWTVREGNFLQEMGQVLAVEIACHSGHPDCVARAKSAFQGWMDTNDNSHIPERLKPPVYCTAIKHGGETEWNFAWQRFLKADAKEKSYLLKALACSEDAHILKTFLQKSKDNSLVRRKQAEHVIEQIGQNKAGKSVAWAFFVDNWNFYFKNYNQLVLPTIVKKLTQHFNNKEDLNNLKTFAEHHNLGTASRAFRQAMESTRANIKWHQNNEDKLRTWLEEKAFSTSQ